MKKLFFVLCLLLALSLLLVACKGNQAPDDDSTPPESLNDDASKPHTHSFGAWKITTAPDCQNEGEEARECACGEVESRAAAITDVHAFNDAHVCTVCGKSESMVRISDLEMLYSSPHGILYFEEKSGGIVYLNPKRGLNLIFSLPHHLQNAPVVEGYSAAELSSLLVLEIALPEDEENEWTHTSFRAAGYFGSTTQATPTETGLLVTHTLRAIPVLPQIIERESFEQKILLPMAKKLNPAHRDYLKFKAFFNELFYATRLAGGETKFAEGIAAAYPIAAEKNIDLYVLDSGATADQKLWLARMILEHCPAYDAEQLQADYSYLEYVPTLDPEFDCTVRLSMAFDINEQGLSIRFADPDGLGADPRILEVVALLPYLQWQNFPEITIHCELPQPPPPVTPEPGPEPEPAPTQPE